MPTPPVLIDTSTRTQATRPIALSTELGADVLLVRSVKAAEGLSRPFEYDLDLLSEHANLHAAKLLGTLAILRISPAGVAPRVVSGYVSAFRRFAPDVSGKLTPYQMTLVPWTFFLTLSRDCRIFQKKTTLDVIADLLKKFKEAHVSEHLTAREQYGKRPYCVQYRETAFNFLHRLLEDEGIFYRFEQDADRHRLALCDSIAVSPDAVFLGGLHHRQQFASRDPQQQVWNWSHHEEMRPGRYSTTDYDFTRPKMPLDASVTADHPTHPASDIFDYPGGYFEPRVGGDHYAPVRLEELQTARSVFRGESNSPTLVPGYAFQLQGDPLHGMPPPRMVVTELVFEANNDDFASAGSSSKFDRPTYKAKFMAVPASEVYRPRRVTSRPVVRGPQTAVVVGKVNDEVYIDKHARIKVKFHWARPPVSSGENDPGDGRHGVGDESSSCWMRVSQAWAGKGYGWLALPRVGHEVIVDFLEGNPDRPIVTGRVYNGENMPPITEAGKNVGYEPPPKPEPPKAAANGKPQAAKASADAKPATAAATAGDDGEADAPAHKEVKPVGACPGSFFFSTPASRGGGGAAAPSGGTPASADDDALPAGVAKANMMTAFRSDSLGGGEGLNEISINDSGSTEGLYFKAQLNEVHEVGQDRIDKIANDEMREVAKNRTRKVGENEQVDIGINQDITVKADRSVTVMGNETHTVHMMRAQSTLISENVLTGLTKSVQTGLAHIETIGMIYILLVGLKRIGVVGLSDLQIVGVDKTDKIFNDLSIWSGNNTTLEQGATLIVKAGKHVGIKAAENVVLEAKNITLKGDGGFIRITSDGIYIKGTKVFINSGGAPDPFPEATPAIPAAASGEGGSGGSGGAGAGASGSAGSAAGSAGGGAQAFAAPLGEGGLDLGTILKDIPGLDPKYGALLGQLANGEIPNLDNIINAVKPLLPEKAQKYLNAVENALRQANNAYNNPPTDPGAIRQQGENAPQTALNNLYNQLAGNTSGTGAGGDQTSSGGGTAVEDGETGTTGTGSGGGSGAGGGYGGGGGGGGGETESSGGSSSTATKCRYHPGREAYGNAYGKSYCRKCIDNMSTAASQVDGHVEPPDCFIVYKGGDSWAPIGGTGCAHWVAHQMGIAGSEGSNGCMDSRAYRVPSVIAGRATVARADVEPGDIWAQADRKHCGLVANVLPGVAGRPNTITIRHCSDAQGGVVSNDFDTHFHGHGTFHR